MLIPFLSDSFIAKFLKIDDHSIEVVCDEGLTPPCNSPIDEVVHLDLARWVVLLLRVDGEVSLTFRCENSELGPFKALIQLLGC